MKKWLRRVRGAIGIGLTWAVGWAVAGVLIGVASILLPGLPWYAFFEVFDAPLPAFAIPGFFAGVFFSAVLAVAGRRQRLRDLSLPRFAAWGAVAGLLLTLFPFALVAVGLASREGSTVGTWQIIAVITGPFVLLSAASASLTLMLARVAERRESRAPASIVSSDVRARFDSPPAREQVGSGEGLGDSLSRMVPKPSLDRSTHASGTAGDDAL